MKKNIESCKKCKIVNTLKNKTLWYVLLIIGLAWIYALVTTQNSNFYPINGDFQNYNPARRFLDGQIPFKEFSVYIGCGQMLLDALGLIVIGNTFTNSLILMRFFSGILLCVFTYVIAYLISDSHRYSALMSAISISIVSIFKYLYPACMIEPGNSARLIRAGILPVELALILVAINVIWKKDIPQNKKLLFISAATGLITGSGIIWSNDYGVASVICISVCYAIAGIKIAQKFSTVLINAGVYILSVLTGFFAAVLIITRGHIGSYFYNTLSSGDYQKWYYRMYDFKAYRFFDFEFMFRYLFGIILLVFALILLFRSKTPKDIFKNSLTVSLFLTTLFASQLYHLMSGTTSTLGLFIVVLFYASIYAVFAIIKITQKKNLLSKFKNSRFLKASTIEALAFIFCVAVFMLQGAYTIYYDIKNGEERIYIGNAIDGRIDESLANPILKAIEITGEEEVFSTYASVLEVYRDDFQPTGFDYIIHALGEENRQKYLDTFKNGDYKYAITSSIQLTPYEYWIKNANWYFYRELCSKYVPTYDNNPWIIWTKSESNVKTYDLSKAKMNVEKIDESSVKITVEYDEKITGTADISISYDTEYNKSFFKTGNIMRLVMFSAITEKDAVNMSGEPIAEGFFNFCLPEQGDCCYIPLTMKDGYGELLITTKPDDDVDLTVNSVELHNIFDFDYIEGNLIQELK